jgi:hypothetical protein
MKTAFIRIGRYTLKVSLAVLALVTILYLILFTPFGNRQVKPLIQIKLTTLLQTPVTIDNLSLTHNTLNLNFHDTHRNTVHIQGKFSLITLTLHAVYQADLSHLNTLKLPLKTTGVLNGGYAAMQAQGSADIFEGNIQYRTQLSHFHPSDLHVSLNRIDYQSLMTWLEYPHRSSTLLNGEVDLHGLDRRNIEGDINLRTHTKHFSPSKIIDDNPSFDFLSLFTDDQGKIQPFHLNVTFNASVDELGILEQFAMLPLRGSANLKTTLQGDQDRLVLDAHSTIAHSDTRARIHWKRLRPSYIYVDIKHADVATLFHLFSKPSPTQGSISLNAESTPKAIHYRGSFTSKVTHLNFDNTATHENMLHDLLKAIP